MVLPCLTIFLIHSCDKHLHGPHTLYVPGTVPERHGSCLLSALLVQGTGKSLANEQEEKGHLRQRKWHVNTRKYGTPWYFQGTTNGLA